MSESKMYILKKDILEFKAGRAVAIVNGIGYLGGATSWETAWKIPEFIIEKEKDWFEEIK